ncbi:MAG TPA: FtsX-like permease family protein [Verrucomicrobiales bacterium]|nr:FtsX-like permease family protein [Verrucomicrobiales bacterium]
MKFSWFLALRYLKPKRTFLSIITVISIAGVSLGVGVLIVVIAVMSGFEKRIKDEWLKVEPPLFLRNEERPFYAEVKEQAAEWRELLPKVKSLPGVESASPYLNVPALVRQAKRKEFYESEIPVEPPGEPAPEPPAPTPPERDTNGVPGASAAPQVPDGGGAKGAQGEPAEPGKASTEPADSGNTPPPNETPVKPATDDSAGDTATGNRSDVSDGALEEGEEAIERSRPGTNIMLMGLETEDAKLMEKYFKRFTELANRRPRPQARGEFDVAGESLVLNEGIAARLYRSDVDDFPTPGETMYSVFSMNFLQKGIAYAEEDEASRGSAEKRAKFEAKDRVYPAPDELLLTGIFNDDKQQNAGQAAIGYVSMKTAQRLAGGGDVVDGIFVEMADAYDAPAMAKRIEESGILPPGWYTETWVQRHRQQFDAVENERGMMYIVLLFISVVAAFCIMNTMITMAVQKRREIGMMRALGAKTSHIVGLFMTKGFIVGLFGTGIGYALGRLVLYFRNDLRTWINDRFGHQIFDSAIYGLNEIPAELRNYDQVLICGIAFVLCTLAAVPPALIVGRMEPARALRNDR